MDTADFTEEEVLSEILSQQEENEKLVEELIAAVKERPNLYDLSQEGFRNAKLKNTEWDAVADQIGKSADWCKTEWTKPRAAYVRKKKSIKGVTGQARKRISADPHFQQMMFLEDSLKGAKTQTNFPKKSKPSTSSQDIDDLTSETEDQPRSPWTTPSENGGRQDKVGYTGNGVREDSSNRNRNRKPDPFEQEVIKYMKSDNQIVQDEHYAYCVSLVDRMRRLEPENAAYLKLKIEQLCSETVYGKNSFNNF